MDFVKYSTYINILALRENDEMKPKRVIYIIKKKKIDIHNKFGNI